jgi:hypothetical protein
MRTIAILSFVIFFFLYPPNILSNTFQAKRVITSEQLQTAGITRIADIFFLIDEWNSVTIDGYTWLTSPGGSTNYQRNHVILMIDGKKYDLTSFDIQNFNMLPVTMNQIDSIEIFSKPVIEQGEFIENGMIHIHTRKILQGSSWQIEYMGGNVTGEPGPYEYTRYSSPDLQRIGEDYALTFEHGFKKNYIRSWIIQQQHPFMEAALSGRCYKILEPPAGQSRSYPGLWFAQTENPKMQRFSLSVKFGGEKFELQTDFSYSFRYLLFFKPLGQEIPVNHIYYHAGLSGIFYQNINYRVGFLTTILEKHPNALDFDFDWKLSQINVDLNKNFKINKFNTVIGFSFDQSILSSYKISNELFKFYTHFDYHFSSTYHQSIGLMLLPNDHPPALKSVLNNLFIINSHHKLNIYLAYSTRNLAEDNNIWYWTDQGYNLLDRYDIGYYQNDHTGNYRLGTLGLEWKSELTSHLRIMIDNSFKFFQNIYLEEQNYQFDGDNYQFFSPTVLKMNQQGQFFKQSMEITAKFPPGFIHNVFYSYQKALNGDLSFIATWEQLTRHKASYQVSYNPFSSFSLWAKLTYFSSSYWPEYRDISGYIYFQSFNKIYRYTATLKPNLILDFQIQKIFWAGRLVTKFLLRNVMNKGLRYHPIGSIFGLTYYIQLGIYI